MLEDVLVAIIDQNQIPVGAGLLITPDTVLTCAHVVNKALGRGPYDTGRPEGNVAVRLLGNPTPLIGQIDPQPDGWSDPPARYGTGDLCILNIPRVPAAKEATIRAYANPAGRFFRVSGFPTDWKGGLDVATGNVIGQNEYGLYLLRSQVTAGKKGTLFNGKLRPAGGIHRGFSGSPVESGGLIIGLVTEAREPSDLTAYMIPASDFPVRFASLLEQYKNPVLERFPHVREFASEQIYKTPNDKVVPFDLRLRFCADFNEALEVHRTPPASTPGTAAYLDDRDLLPSRVAGMLYRRKDDRNVPLTKILVHAPGGAGKSSYLFELLQSAPDENLVPFTVDFSKQDTTDYGAKLLEPTEQLRSWFNHYQSVGDVDKLLALASDAEDELRPLLVIDGFNQAGRQWSELLRVITKLSTGALAGASIIVADRMVDRGSAMDKFRHATVPPLSREAYIDVLREPLRAAVIDHADWRPILSSPLFLNLLLTLPGDTSKQVVAVPSRFQILNSYLRQECGFSTPELRVLADFAYHMYDSYRQTAIPKSEIEKFYAGAGSDLRDRMEAKGLVHHLGDNDVELRHQIIHDSLVALKVASSTERNDEILLREPAFNIVSLNAASHDAIELAMEALSHPAELLEQRRKPLGPREFLTAVFDWNYWITLQCVASFDRRRVSPLPEWMRHAIYAHNLERRFDPFLHTVWRAERLRGQIPSSPDLTYLGAESRDVIAKEIEKTVGQLQHPDKAEDDYRRHWLGLYLRNKPFTIKDIEPLWQDPLLSWTAANTIRRCENPPEITEELVRMYRVSKATSDSSPKAAMFRWRLVHALGRGTTAALKMLTDVALDPFENADARYGAFRSLVELVVTKGTGQEQMEILDVVESGLSELFAGESARDLSRVRREIRRTCAFNEPCVRGRNGWLEDWLAKGLPKFSRILREGEAWARKTQTLNLEAEIWKEWAIAAEAAPKHSPEARREKWLEVIERDQ